MEYVIFFIAALIGISIKILEKVIAIRETDGGEMTIVVYVKEQPYRMTLSLLGTAILLFICYQTDQINAVSAFASGYVGESAARFITQKFKV